MTRYVVALGATLSLSAVAQPSSAIRSVGASLQAPTGRPGTSAPANSTLKQIAAVQLDGVEGRFDHMAADIQQQRLFVAALGNNSVEVLDMRAGTRLHSIRDQQEPQGIAFLPDRNLLVVANGQGGACRFFDSRTFGVVSTLTVSDDADNVRYDPAASRIYIGYGRGGLAVVGFDGKQIGNVLLKGHPESFQLEKDGSRIFVNVPEAGHIAVVDRGKQAVTATWPVEAARSNYPMALDDANHRLFVGCRRPARLLVYDTSSGQMKASVEIVGDTDDLFYDRERRRIYVSGGAGAITVLQQSDPDHYSIVEQVPTAAGARTSLFVPELTRLFVAVPHRGAQRAEIRVFESR